MNDEQAREPSGPLQPGRFAVRGRGPFAVAASRANYRPMEERQRLERHHQRRVPTCRKNPFLAELTGMIGSFDIVFDVKLKG